MIEMITTTYQTFLNIDIKILVSRCNAWDYIFYTVMNLLYFYCSNKEIKYAGIKSITLKVKYPIRRFTSLTLADRFWFVRKIFR